MVKKIIQFILIGLFYFQPVYLQHFRNKVRFYNIQDGLSQSGINYLLVDSKGFLWAATSDGLNRYDGNSFLVFKHIPNDTNSLCDNYVRHLCEDTNGNIWIATSNGLSCFVRQKGIFLNYHHEPGNEHSLYSNNIFRVYQDKQGTIWVKTIETIEKFNFQTKKFTHYFHYNNIFNYASSDYFFSIFEDSKNRLWIGTKDGLNYFDRNLELFKRYIHDPTNKFSISDNRIKAIVEDKNGNLWVGTENGLNCFYPQSGRFVRYFHQPNNPNSLIHNVVNDLHVDQDGSLWIATMEGFSKFDIVKEKFTNFSYLHDGNTQVFLTSISSICTDKSKNLWIGSSEGITKIDLKPFKFGLFSYDKTHYGYNVTGIYIENNNTILTGTRNHGIIKLSRDANNNFFVTKNYDAYDKQVNAIYSFFKEPNGNFWLGTSNGIYYLPVNSNSFFKINKVFGNSDFLENNKIYAFYKDKNNVLWIGSEYGLHQFDFKSKKWHPYIQIPDSQGISIRSARCFATDKIGNIWIGTDDGLVRYNLETKELKKYLSNPRRTIRSLPSNSIYSLMFSSKGILWVGTNAGLCKYNETSDDFTIFTEFDGLPNNTIYAMLEDDKGNLWLSSNKGIILFEQSIEVFTTFDLADGMQGYEFNLGSAAKSNNGELFFGGLKGINYFFPDSLKPFIHDPITEVTSIEILSIGIKRIYALYSGVKISIPANTKLFTIYFSALDLTYPQNNKYMYKLSSTTSEGLWINNGNKNYVQFSNLPAGNYTFYVRGSNSDQVWSKEPFVIHLTIETPFYKSRIAILMYIVLLLMGTYLAIKWRTSYLINENRILYERNTALSEIHRQKEELTIKNKNITDSINYAKRIQMAMLPSERNFKRLLPNSFVLYKPKDIVSGDFYWIYERVNKVFIVTADCTGHGVPGAFMSILGIELLRNITSRDIEDPGVILNQMNIEISRVFAGMEDFSIKDGIDISFVVFDKKTNQLSFAGAEQNIYHIQNNQIAEIKGNRFSIGFEQDEKDDFTTYTLNLQLGDMVYMFTDGYADQFGGPEGKKFKYRRFRHLLLNIHKLPLEQQKEILNETIEIWRGNQEQVDDILIIGIRAVEL